MVLVDSGGNGGGGICVARHLANRGAKVRLCLSSPDHLKEVPLWQHHIVQFTPGQEMTPSELTTSSAPVDPILDALIGYSLRSVSRGMALDLIQWANQTEAPILSLDIPSGVDATTGSTPGTSIHARWTITLALPKTGLLSEKTGELFLADIGIPTKTYTWGTLQLSYTPPFGDRYRIPGIVMTICCKGMTFPA